MKIGKGTEEKVCFLLLQNKRGAEILNSLCSTDKAIRRDIEWRPLRMSFRRIPMVIRVACKLHNFLIIDDGSPIEVARGDFQRYTDGTAGAGRGRRSDWRKAILVRILTQTLRELRIVRPPHSCFSRVGRI